MTVVFKAVFNQDYITKLQVTRLLEIRVLLSGEIRIRVHDSCCLNHQGLLLLVGL
jgi:hypothetical protein